MQRERNLTRDVAGATSAARGATREHRPSPDLVMESAFGLHQIVPAQFFDRSGGHRLSAEQRLMLALLGDAIRVYRQGALSRTARKRMLYVDAERWIMAPGRNPFAFGFETVCEALGLEPSALRQRLISWKHQAWRQPELSSVPNLRLKMTARDKSITQGRTRGAGGRDR